MIDTFLSNLLLKIFIFQMFVLITNTYVHLFLGQSIIHINNIISVISVTLYGERYKIKRKKNCIYKTNFNLARFLVQYVCIWLEKHILILLCKMHKNQE